MAGLYLHIPFCENICPYCDFSTWKTGVHQHERWLNTIKREIEVRNLELNPFSTLYFGGGTPSLLSLKIFSDTMEYLNRVFSLSSLKEISLEANPGNLNEEKLKIYAQSGINRISLGAQSFDAGRLKWLGRNHQKEDILKSVELCHKYSMDVNLDIIFATEGQTVKELISDLETAVKISPQHISLYGLSYESNTLFFQHKNKGLRKEVEEELYVDMYLKASDYLNSHNLFRYEVSNFSLPGKECLHNQGYWDHSPYLGLGPGAHSLINNTRYFNNKKFASYEKHVWAGYPEGDDVREVLSIDNLYHERIWLSLRTIQGLDTKELKSRFGKAPSPSLLNSWVEKNWLENYAEDKFRLKAGGWALIDSLALEALN